MQTEPDPQREIIAFLSQAAAYGARGEDVRRIETHISVIFLVGDRAYKLKRALRLPYLDFATLEARRRACEAELRINRRTAPGLYLGVVPVTRAADGALALEGPGEAVEWLVEMNRFDQDALLSHLADTAGLGRHLVEDLALAIARFHGAAEVVTAGGGADAIARILANNAESCARFDAGVFDAKSRRRLDEDGRDHLARLAPLLDRRRADGHVRRCHGDLHLSNIVVLEGAPVLFDAIEFSDEFAVIDVFYDLAFLLMDLDCRGLGRAASQVLNRYLDVTGDVGGLACLPLFLSMRAGVRAHVNAAAAAQVSRAEDARARTADARAYLEAARAYLAPPPPSLVAIGGLSATGKSNLARGLAPSIGAAPGAFIARSDAIRKRLADTDPHHKLGPQAYTPEMSDRVYARLVDDAKTALAAGHSVIADAVFARPEERAAMARAAGAAGVPFDGIWLDAGLDIRQTRVAARTRNVSDATPEVLQAQMDYDPGVIDWHRLDASVSKKETRRKARAILGLE